MKPAALFAMTHLTVTQFETRQRRVGAELRRDRDAAASRPERPRRSSRLLRAVRGAAAA